MKPSLSKSHYSEYMSCLWDTVIFVFCGEIRRKREPREGNSKSVLDFSPILQYFKAHTTWLPWSFVGIFNILIKMFK